MSELEEASVLQSAHHSDISSTAKYLGDAGTLKSLMDPNDPHHQVGRWQPIHINTIESFTAINIESSQYTKPLPDLASWYIFNTLHVPCSLDVSFMQIHRMAYVYSHSRPYTQGKVEKKLAEKYSGEEYDEMVSLYKSSVDECIQVAQNPPAAISDETSNTLSTSTIQPTTVSLLSIDGPPAKKQKLNPKDFLIVSMIIKVKQAKKVRAKDAKVKVCIECVNDIKQQISQGKILVDPLWSFAYHASKVSKCVKDCHGNDVESFIKAKKMSSTLDPLTIHRFDMVR